MRMKDERVPRKAFIGYMGRRRPVGRPRGRWIEKLAKGKGKVLPRTGREGPEEG
jgi:hypothetical protein